MVISSFYLDFGNKYAFEVAQYSYKSNDLLVLEFIYISIFILFIFMFTIKRKLYYRIFLNKLKYPKYIRLKYIQLFLFFAYLYIGIIILHMMISGIPIFMGEHKGMFWSHAKIPFFHLLHNQTSTIIFIAGFLYAYIKIFKLSNNKYTNLLKYFKPLLWIYIAYIFMMGYKFGGPLQYLFSFYISYLILLSMQKEFSLVTLFKYISYFAAFIIPMVLFVYMYLNSYGDNAIQMLFDRIFTLQGQVWHFIYNDIRNGRILPNIDHIYIEVDNLIHSNHINESGMNYLMQYIMPATRLNNYLDEGVRLSGGYPAILFVVFNNFYVIFLINLLLAYIIYLFHITFFYHLIKLNLFKSLLWFKLSLQSEGILFMADINSLFSSKILFYLLILLLIKLIEQKNANRRVTINENLAYN